MSEHEGGGWTDEEWKKLIHEATATPATDTLKKMGVSVKMEEPIKENPCLEMSPPRSNSIQSDGGSSSYYIFQLPVYPESPKYQGGKAILGYAETEDVIQFMVGNDFDLGNIVKASRRISSGRRGIGKAGTSELYDWKKIKHTAEKNIKRLRGE